MFKKFALLCGLAVMPLAHAEGSAWSGNVNLLFGTKGLDDVYWYPVEKQGEFGVMLDFKQEAWPFSIAIDMLGSGADDTSTGFYVEGRTSEFDLGVRKIFELPDSTIRPFIGGGLAMVSAEYTVGLGGLAVTDSDAGVGIWLNGGVYWTLAQSFNLGFQVRTSSGDVTLYGVEGSAGGGHAGFMVGYHW